MQSNLNMSIFNFHFELYDFFVHFTSLNMSSIDRYIDLILAVSISLSFIMWLIVTSKRKSKYGLNFERVYCPVCSIKQSIVRIPKNQILYGGIHVLNVKQNLISTVMLSLKMRIQIFFNIAQK